jgi:hypothetical protein
MYWFVDFVLCYMDNTEPTQLFIAASKDSKMNKQSTAGMRKRTTFTHQKPEITGTEWNTPIISYAAQIQQQSQNTTCKNSGH